MKNFIFPQIFHPVIYENNFPSFQHYQNTYRRIQTQVQLTRENLHLPLQKKSTQLNDLLKSFSTNLNKRTENKIYQSGQEEIIGKQNIKMKSQRQQKNNQNNINLAYKQYSIRITKPKSIIVNKSKNTTSRKQVQGQSKNTELIKKSNNLKQNKEKIYPVSYSNNQMKGSSRQNNKTLKNNAKKQIRFQMQNKNQKINNLKSQKSITKKVQFRDNKSIASSKKILPKKNLTSEKRRKAVEVPPSFHQNVPNQSPKGNIVHKISINDHKSKVQKMKEELSSQYPGIQSFQSFLQVDQFTRKRRVTFHAFQSSHKQIRLQKRSYTIWDLSRCVSDYENEYQESSEQFECRKQQQADKADEKKKKKKVHFGRTSIQGKTMQNQTKQEIKQTLQRATQNKIAKFKGLISRSKRNDSINQFQSVQSIDKQRNKKQINNLTIQMRRGVKMRKLETQNIYNELNYLRMRLNIQKRNKQEPEVCKPHPQAITLSVERVLNQQQLERINKTRINNMMIDFGVRMTKDSMLKQKALKDRIKNIFI